MDRAATLKTDAFNRIVLVLLALALLVCAGAVLLVVLDIFDPEQLAPADWFEDRLTPFSRLTHQEAAWAVGICLALLVAAVALLFVELGLIGDDGRVVVKEDALGRITIHRSGIAGLAEHEAMQVPGVMESRAAVEKDGDGVKIYERVSIEETASVPEVTESVRERVKTAVERQVGRPTSNIRVDAQLQPLDRGRRVR